jgi:hypothetical protein
MAHIEQAVRKMLRDASALSSIPDARFTYGFRPELTANTFPAVVFTVSDMQNQTLDGSQKRVRLTVHLVHATVNEATELADEVRQCVAPGTYNSFVIGATVFQSYNVQEPVVGDGDEAQPAIITHDYDLYYREP